MPNTHNHKQRSSDTSRQRINFIEGTRKTVVKKIHRKFIQEKKYETNRNLKMLINHEAVDRARKEKLDRVEEANRKFRENYINNKSPTTTRSSNSTSKKISFAVTPKSGACSTFSHKRTKSPLIVHKRYPSTPKERIGAEVLPAINERIR